MQGFRHLLFVTLSVFFLFAAPIKASDVITGLIIDTTGLTYIPTMTPRIDDSLGFRVYGSMHVSPKYAQEQGIVGYAKSIDQARQNLRVGNNPIVVKAVRIDTNKHIILSQKDATHIRQMAKFLNFLDRARVVIVVD